MNRSKIVLIGSMISSHLLTLLLLEGLVRIFLPQQLILVRPDVWIPDNVVGWRHSPNLDAKINTGEREIRLLTDAYGHRIGIESHGTGNYRILALGDSFLAALQVEYKQTMTAQLEEMLSKELNDRVMVVNTGVDDWGPNQYLLEAKQELKRTRYDLVLAFLYMPNDVIRKQLERIPPKKPVVRHQLRLPQKLEMREIINALAHPINDFLEVRSHLYILLKNRAQYLLARMGLSALYFPDVLLRSLADSPRWAMTADVCASIASEAAHHNVPVLFVLLPGLYQVDQTHLAEYIRAFDKDPSMVEPEQPARLLTRELKARGFTVVDTTDVLKAASTSGQADTYGQIDRHFGPGGHQIVANFLEPMVLDFLINGPRPLGRGG